LNWGAFAVDDANAAERLSQVAGSTRARPCALAAGARVAKKFCTHLIPILRPLKDNQRLPREAVVGIEAACRRHYGSVARCSAPRQVGV
jgi:hypothetical protein